MKKILVIARWEYLERVKSRVFIVSLILMPVIMISLAVLPVLLVGPGSEDEPRVIAVADLTGTLLSRFASRVTESSKDSFGVPLCVVRPIELTDSADEAVARVEGDRLVLSGNADAFCILKEVQNGRYAIECRTRGFDEFPGGKQLENVLKSLLLEDLLTSLGMPANSAGWIDSSVEVSSVVLSPVEDRVTEYAPEDFLKVFFSAYVFLMMLFFLILSSGQLLVRSVLEEKMNRIVEILVSACSPTELMAGKILGLSFLGFTQMAVWVVAALLLSHVAALPISVHDHAILLVIYFVLGYLLYASLFVAIGSPVTTEQEAQHVMGYLVVVLVLPLVLSVPVIQDPGAEWISILSFIPLMTPTMMGLRIALGTVPPGEIVATVILLIISIFISLFIAGRIFRIAILSTGKSPAFGEIVSWVRTRG
jgi:ABC-2 type transport system permease protein